MFSVFSVVNFFSLHPMTVSLQRVQHAVTAVTGFEKGSGKTTFLNLALPVARHAGPVAVFTIGVDGGAKAREDGAGTPDITVAPGDLVVTTEAFARASDARFEVLEALPGRTALGRLLLGRAVRAGSVTLVGSASFTDMADLIERVRAEAWAASVLVDGAVNRVTQVSALGAARFAFTARIHRGNLAKAAAKLQALAALADLTAADSSELAWKGPLTMEGLAQLPPPPGPLSLGSFSDVFLEPADLKRLLTRYDVRLRRPLDLLCFSIVLRDLSRDTFLETVGPSVAERVLFNPYEVVA